MDHPMSAYPPPTSSGHPPITQAPGSQAVLMAPTRFGSVPMRTKCTFCQQEIVTNIRHVVGLTTWLACGGVCFIGCIAGCCLIPFCLDMCKDVEHICPSCNNTIGVHKLMN